MIVTDKNYFVEKLLVEKLDLMCERVTKHKFDNLIIIDGDEGYGKSNLASSIAYYQAWKSKRPFSNKNVFFLVDEMINFAVSTKEQVIWWDESALGALASESYSKVQTKLLQLLMIGRKKQHFYIFVIPKFYRLREAIIDRAIALIHVYSRDQISRGRYSYCRKVTISKLYEHWRQTRKKGYKYYYDFLGSFSETLPIIIDEKVYDHVKDNAILTLGNTNDSKTNELAKKDLEIHKLRALYAALNKFEGINQKKLAKYAGITPRTLIRWSKLENLTASEGKSDGDKVKTIVSRGEPLMGAGVMDNDDPSASPITLDDGHDDDSPISIADDPEEP